MHHARWSHDVTSGSASHCTFPKVHFDHISLREIRNDIQIEGEIAAY